MKRVFLLGSMFFLVLNLAAQEGKVMLSFDQALTMTMTDNPQISALEYQERAADQQRKAAIGLRSPQIGVNASYAHLGRDVAIDINDFKPGIQGIAGDVIAALGQHGIVVPPEVLGDVQKLFGADWGSFPLQKQNVAVAGATVTMPVYTGGKINAANAAAQINQRSVLEQSSQARNALVSELVERYYGLVLANQVVQVRQQVVDGVRVHLNDAIALEATGVIAKGERLYAQVKMAEAQRELLNAELQRQTIESALCNTLNTQNAYLPVSCMFMLPQIESVDYFREIALRNSPLLNQVSLKKDLAEQDVKLKRSEFLPEVALMGGASFYNYQLSKMVPRWAVGAGVSLKLFDGVSREFKFSAAKNTVRQVEALEAKAANDIGILIDKLYNQLQSYHDQMPSIEASMAFAEEYLRVKDAAFKAGMASAADVIDAQLNLAKIKTERIQAAYYYDLMLAKLLEASGISNEFTAYCRRPDARPILFE